MGNIHINMDGGQPTEKEIDATITKMEKIIKKKKGNYKNMDLLENIYEDDDDNKGGILESLQEFEKELNNINESMKEITQEVIQQIKSDVTKLVNFLTPSPEVQQMLREQEKKIQEEDERRQEAERERERLNEEARRKEDKERNFHH